MCTNNKYELTNETCVTYGVTLHRIKALKDFGDVKAGDLGGWIAKEGNLSQDDKCWVYGDSIVYGNAIISGNAVICDDATVMDNAIVMNDAKVMDNATVSGNAIVSGASFIGGDALITGNAIVTDCSQIYSGVLMAYTDYDNGTRTTSTTLSVIGNTTRDVLDDWKKFVGGFNGTQVSSLRHKLSENKDCQLFFDSNLGDDLFDDLKKDDMGLLVETYKSRLFDLANVLEIAKNTPINNGFKFDKDGWLNVPIVCNGLPCLAQIKPLEDRDELKTEILYYLEEYEDCKQYDDPCPEILNDKDDQDNRNFLVTLMLPPYDTLDEMIDNLDTMVDDNDTGDWQINGVLWANQNSYIHLGTNYGNTTPNIVWSDVKDKFYELIDKYFTKGKE